MILFAQFQKTNFANYCFFLIFFHESKNFDFFFILSFLSPNPNLQQQQQLKNQGERAINIYIYIFFTTYNIHFKPT